MNRIPGSVAVGMFDAASASEPARLGQGIEITLEHTWPWPPWVTLLGFKRRFSAGSRTSAIPRPQ